jgi:CRISPR-associated protein Csx17
LAHYLKALGVVRLVSEQVDSEARCYWKRDAFHLISGLDEESLIRFFLEEYSPTPVLAPWNGGSGFYYREELSSEKDPVTGKRKRTGRRNQPTAATKVVDSILKSSTVRLDRYRRSIAVAKEVLETTGMEEATTGKSKEELIQAIRNRLSDDAITWLDASVVLTEENAKYPPLLGTGGNDGNTDFSSNFMQRLCEVFDPDSGGPTALSESWLRGSLFATTLDGLVKGAASGQFYPSAVGGANAESGFGSDSVVNPWDFILNIEGSLLFAAASVKRLQNTGPGVLSYPFSVRSSGVGYGSASQTDEVTSRAEIWVPMWSRPTGVRELKALMSEGRAQVRGRSARNGVDFAQSVATLGVDRGLESFERYGFHVRNGLAYFATPLGRFRVNRQPQVELLSDMDSWLVSFREKASSEKAPTSVVRALRTLDSSILALCKERSVGRVQDVMIALGDCERAVAQSIRWANEANVRPVPPLSDRWLSEADDGSPEFRLAASLASIYGHYKEGDGQNSLMPLRSQMEPVNVWTKGGHMRVSFAEVASRDGVWADGDPVSALNRLMSRRVMRAVQSGLTCYPDRGRINANLGDVAAFVEGHVNLSRMVDLLWGLILLDWPAVGGETVTRSYSTSSPGAAYELMKLCFSGSSVRDVEVPLMAEVHRRASLGDSFGAVQLAVRRLRGSGLVPALESVDLSQDLVRRTAAALLFPLRSNQVESIADRVLRPEVKS